MVESRINVTFNKRKKLFKVVRLDLQTMTNQQLLYRRVSELKFSSQRIWSVNECLLSHGKEVSRLTEISLRNWDGTTGASGRMKKNYTSERASEATILSTRPCIVSAAERRAKDRNSSEQNPCESIEPLRLVSLAISHRRTFCTLLVR